MRVDKGEALAGAHVKLTTTAGQVIAETSTSETGGYTLDGVAAGSYILLITGQSLLPASYPIRIPEEGGSAEVNVSLKVPSVSDSITVSGSGKDIAEAEMKLQEQQRLAAIFPNFFVSYQWKAAPLSAGQKFSLALKNATDPGNLLLAGVTAGTQQATNSFPGYGQGVAGYSRRYGANVGNLVAGTFMGGAVFPSLFHQDPRYFYRGTGSVKSRLWYAITRAVVTRGDNGNAQPNWSGIVGDMSAGAISNLYYAPEDRNGARLTLINGLLSIGGDAMNGIFQEFILRKFTTHTKGRKGEATSLQK